MSLPYGSMNTILPIIERLTRMPGKILVLLASGANILLVLLGYIAGKSSSSTTGWIPFVCGLLFSALLIFFEIRRRRLENRITEHFLAKINPVEIINENGSVISETAVVIPGPNPNDMADEAQRLTELRRLDEARREAQLRKNVIFPRIEAAQRAAIARAGGVHKAPYLQDDIRWTILSGLLTLISLPISGIFLLACLFILL